MTDAIPARREPPDDRRSAFDPSLLLHPPPGDLTLDDFRWIGPPLELVRGHLDRQARAGPRGLNVLIHGPSGSGRSSLPAALAGSIGWDLFLLPSFDEDGNALEPATRAALLAQAQTRLAGRRALLMVDDADAFPGLEGKGWDPDCNEAVPLSRSLAWLREATVPTFWVVGSPWGLPPAVRRNFDAIVSMRDPPEQFRTGLLRAVAGDLLGDETMARLARHRGATAANLVRAAAMVRGGGEHLDEPSRVEAFRHCLDALGGIQAPEALPPSGPSFDPAYLGAQVNVDHLLRGLRCEGEGRLLLHGPSGSGKTAFAGWLARELGRPLRVLLASDLLSCYVGGTEERIALAFRRALEGGEVLLIDEAEGLMRHRELASRGWELTMVGELLNQVERFRGMVLFATNHAGEIDRAFMRRIDLNLRFGFLSREQAWSLFCSTCDQLGIRVWAKEALARRFAVLTRLVPGDFATVVRRHRLQPLANAGACMEALEAECRLRSAW